MWELRKSRRDSRKEVWRKHLWKMTLISWERKESLKGGKKAQVEHGGCSKSQARSELVTADMSERSGKLKIKQFTGFGD